MVYFRSLTQNQTSAKAAAHLTLAAQTAFPVGRRHARDLVKLRCVAGQEFIRQTGQAQAQDLTPAQMHFGQLGVIDRHGPMGVFPAFERF